MDTLTQAATIIQTLRGMCTHARIDKTMLSRLKRPVQDRFQISLKRMCATGDREGKELPGCARFELGGVFQGHAAADNDVVTGVVVHQLLVLARPAPHVVMYH